MVAPQADISDIADDLEVAAKGNAALAEALEDYREACERANDEKQPPGHRADWQAVRAELADEVRRLLGRHHGAEANKQER